MSQESQRIAHYDYKNLLRGMMRKFSWILLLLMALLVFVGCDAFMMRDDAAGHFLVKEQENPVEVSNSTFVLPDKLTWLVPKTEADPLPQDKITWEKDGAEMALIPSASFEMGDSKNEPEDWMKRSRPVHTVELDEFYMDVHEVTVGQFKQFVEQSGYSYGGNWDTVAKYSPGDEYPMVYISRNDATAYAKWAGKRLPTEAEWEYAARGGLAGERYPWGGALPNGRQCNYADKNADAVLRSMNKDYDWADMKVDDGYAKCAPVGSYPANGYGLYDLAGNVWEWCADWYGSDYYSKSPAKNPLEPGTGGYRVLRGAFGLTRTTSCVWLVAAV